MAVIIVVAAYIAAQMLADIASLKIGLVWGLAVDMGTFIYPLTFTLRDLAHKTVGKKNTQVLILTAGAVNLLMAAYLTWAAWVQSDPSWGLGAEFKAVLAPVWRLVLASIVADEMYGVPIPIVALTESDFDYLQTGHWLDVGEDGTIILYEEEPGRSTA